MVVHRDLFFHGSNRINMNEELMGTTDISRIYIRYVSDSSDYKHYINNTQVVIQRENLSGVSDIVELIDISDVSGVSSGDFIVKSNGLNYIDLSQSTGKVTGIGIIGYWQDHGIDGSGSYIEVKGKVDSKFQVYRPYYKSVSLNVKNSGNGFWNVPKNYPFEQDLQLFIYDSRGLTKSHYALSKIFDIGLNLERAAKELARRNFIIGLFAKKSAGDKNTFTAAVLSSTNDGGSSPLESPAAIASILSGLQSDGSQGTGGDTLTQTEVDARLSALRRLAIDTSIFINNRVLARADGSSLPRMRRLKALALI